MESPEVKNPNNQDILNHLRKARRDVENQSALIADEMKERGLKGQLWTNGQCKAWENYESAVTKLASLRDKYEV
jgi:hypothetical protein